MRIDTDDYGELNRQALQLGTKPASLARMLVRQGLKRDQKRKPRKSGSAKDEILWIAPDFDETPEDFNDYM